MAGDYLISQIGPPAHFLQQRDAVIARGMKLAAKTCHSYANEFVNVPYIPIAQQFHLRIAAMRRHPIRAYLANWTHYGYCPSLNAEILKWCSWDREPPIDELLRSLAAREFGAQAAEGFVSAWDHFSRAIRLYPYSDRIARRPGPIQSGPAHPLYLDPAVKTTTSWRGFVNDLSGTEPWGPEMVLKCFGLLESEWLRGLEVMKDAMAAAPPEKMEAARREWGVAKSILCTVRSYMNLTRFLVERQRLYSERDKPKRDEILGRMRKIAESEAANAREALPLCEADSRIGYASGGSHIGGLYTPASIRSKIAQVERMINEEMPRLASSPNTPPPRR
jgi:hypothetical protein